MSYPATSRPVRYGRWGLAEDPIGFQVMLKHGERMLLGDVRETYVLDHYRGGIMLRVTHFNGEPWPFDPCAAVVRIIGQRTTDDQP